MKYIEQNLLHRYNKIKKWKQTMMMRMKPSMTFIASQIVCFDYTIAYIHTRSTQYSTVVVEVCSRETNWNAIEPLKYTPNGEDQWKKYSNSKSAKPAT